MLVTALFLVTTTVLLAGLGRAVRPAGPLPDAEPAFARHVVAGVLVLAQLSASYSQRIEWYVREMRGEPLVHA
ncbi:hypothetical protein [Prauserella muralis]|uniref:Uncharacterized protein n=2 Tax=Prauserella muralis TaxID=588067 RepID=A0A2V4B1N2_9PSEU|nr:hypothetical protein [Prauserella muralis]PXY27947.1 hypothetical protein BAY60_16495 [Prauserella muralis]TWE22266.1 hypothetical protein FHX69_3502 [Prauserella muralis]